MAVALDALVRDIPDFPKPGIVFKDITPLLASPEGLDAAVTGLADVARGALPALVIAHGGSIRCAFATRDPRGLASFQSLAVPNGELMRLPPRSPGYG